LTLGLVSGIVAAPGLRAQAPDEDHGKAATLLKFAQFASWPDGRLPAGEKFKLCVLRPHRLGSSLERLTAGHQVDGRPVAVHEIARVRDVPACHLLFIPAGTGRAVLRRAAALPVLTVGEDADFLDRGGIIRLRPAGSDLHFDINAAQAGRVRVQLSAQLLRLAQHVRGGRS
jgi:hypothetical protein